MTNEEKSMNSATPGGLSPSRTTTLDQESTSRKRILTKNALVHMERNSLFDRHTRSTQASRASARCVLPRRVFAVPRNLAFTADSRWASFPVPAGSSCVLHPDGQTQTRAQSIPVRVRCGRRGPLPSRPPGAAGSAFTGLALDCTDANGIQPNQFWSIFGRRRLFAPRVFDPAVANLDYRRRFPPIRSATPRKN